MKMRERLALYGIPGERCEILNVNVDNAPQSTADPHILAQVQRCTGLFMTGGDQNRIVQALVQRDGGETPLLREMRKLFARGGLIAGSSAGAAVQSDPMLSVSGLPDESLDEGLDALDFGLTDHLVQRGLHVTRGLGFFTFGLIDQHFHQYRGRLGRLVRATVERKIPYGFGIDENTALVALPNGTLEVVGPGNITLVKSSHAIGKDGPLGCRIQQVELSLLSHGDQWNSATQAITVHSAKKPIVVGAEDNIGSFLIPDIGSEGAVPLALLRGLANNSQQRQQGIVLKHYDGVAHGYRFTFRKTKSTRAHHGYVDDDYSYTVQGVELDIEPIDARLRASHLGLPLDVRELPAGPTRIAVETLWFRGILPNDESAGARPKSIVTRGEFAQMLARSVHLLPARQPRNISDVAVDSSLADEVGRVVHADLMSLDERQAFRPSVPLTRLDAARALNKLARRISEEERPANLVPLKDLDLVSVVDQPAVLGAVAAGWLAARDGHFQPQVSCTREEAAVGVYKVVEFPW